MKLTKEQSQKLLRERGIWVTEACDKCGRLLGSVRYTRRGEPGEWCSESCRDGVDAGAVSDERRRKGGRRGVPRPLRGVRQLGARRRRAKSRSTAAGASFPAARAIYVALVVQHVLGAKRRFGKRVVRGRSLPCVAETLAARRRPAGPLTTAR